jgi:polyphosphate kinase 2 (PPK2 family)
MGYFERFRGPAGSNVLRHSSKKPRLRRFRAPLEDRARRSSVSESDSKEREFWGDYWKAYEDASSRCGAPGAP